MLDVSQGVRRDQIALREHHEIGAGELILEYFLDRIVMIDGIIRRALCRDRAFI